MTQVTVVEAKTHLSRLIQRVEAGEDIVIVRAGKPVAKLVRYAHTPIKRIFGSRHDDIWVADDFDAPLPEEILRAFRDNGGS